MTAANYRTTPKISSCLNFQNVHFYAPLPRGSASWIIPLVDGMFDEDADHRQSPSYKSVREPADKLLIPLPLPANTASVFARHSLARMQDPKKEIANIVRTLCTTRDANELQETVVRYFAEDAKFWHPTCRANSRNEILGLFQWYRLASPEVQIQVLSVMYDTELNVLVLDVREKPNVWFLPLPSESGRVVVRLQLRKAGGSHYIILEEDLVHPMDQIGFLAAPLLPLTALYLRLGCLLSNLGACVFRTVGLNSGLQGGTVSYAGLLEAAGLVRTPGDKANGNAKE